MSRPLARHALIAAALALAPAPVALAHGTEHDHDPGHEAADAARGLDAHEHGVGAFDVAIDGQTVEMALEAPGADIVGFEHEAESAEDRAAIEVAKGRLADALALFTPSAAADCRLASTEVALIGDEGHDDHGHGHDEAEAEHGHDHDEAQAGHDDDHAEGAGHTEFRATWRLTCTAPEALTEITFGYFETFPNARKLRVQMVGPRGATGAEVTREAPVMEIPGTI